MSVLHLNESEFDAKITSAPLAMVDFWATWCGPCKMVSPIVDEIAAERSDLVVGKVNVDEQMELAVQFGITSIPTLMVFKGGKVVNKTIGYTPKEEILAMLK